MDQNSEYIVVDLDGTLIRTDLLLESVLLFIKSNLLNLFLLIAWVFRGRAFLKARIAERVNINAENLPYREDLLDYLRKLNEQGKTLLLATASHEKYANEVAGYLGIFKGVLATTEHYNMKGSRKLAAIREKLEGNQFAYAGDSRADMPLWEASDSCIMVNAPKEAVQAAQQQGKAIENFNDEHSTLTEFLREMRLYQWVKNILIFVPVFTSHNYQDTGHILHAGIAFISFGLCASGVYFLNDLLDLNADRHHKSKRNRPLASGRLPILHGLLGAAGLPLLGFLLAIYTLPLNFVLVMALYYLITNAYSFWFKQMATVDVMILAILYTLRIVAGSAAEDIALSSWLLAFSVFVFLSLAYLKRYIEVSALEDNKTVRGRGYSAADSETMFSLGISNITASVLVLALYINSEEIAGLYHSPMILWLLCLLTMFWGNRIWVRARRGEIHDDPIVFAIKDRVSQLVGVAFVIVVLAAKYISL